MPMVSSSYSPHTYSTCAKYQHGTIGSALVCTTRKSRASEAISPVGLRVRARPVVQWADQHVSKFRIPFIGVAV